MFQPFDSDAALWVSEVPAFGVVRHVVHYLSYAARYDDLNGDLREVAFSIHERMESGTWAWLYQQDDYVIPSRGDVLDGEAQDHVWAVGRSRPHREVLVTLQDETYVVPSDADGLWLLVQPFDTDHLRYRLTVAQ